MPRYARLHRLASRPVTGPSVALVASLPHGSTFVPGHFAPDLVPSRELWVDAFTPELYGFLARFGASAVCARYSQFVANPNRRPTAPRFAPFWEGIVASTDPDGRPLYSVPPTATQLAKRITIAYDAYHSRLDAQVARRLERSERVTLVDLHSFGMDLGTDVVLGDGRGTTAAPKTVDRLEQAFVGEGFTVARNLRFAGGWIVRRFAGNDRVDAVQIELNQRCYADPAAVDARELPLALDGQRSQEASERLERVFDRALRAGEC